MVIFNQRLHSIFYLIAIEKSYHNTSSNLYHSCYCTLHIMFMNHLIFNKGHSSLEFQQKRPSVIVLIKIRLLDMRSIIIRHKIIVIVIAISL